MGSTFPDSRGPAAPISRRAVLKAGLYTGATAVGLTGVAAAGFGVDQSKPSAARPPAAAPGGSSDAPPTVLNARKIADLSGPQQTGPFASPWSDLGIPALCPDGTMMFIAGDTFNGPGLGVLFGGYDWRSPVGFRARNTALDTLKIESCVGGSHAVQLIPCNHELLQDGPAQFGYTTIIPTDIFTIGTTMYMHVIRGVIYHAQQSELWQSTDNGESWQYMCTWPASQYDGHYEQKTFAVANDGYCYVLSTRYNRDFPSALLLSRVRQESLADPQAYETWGVQAGKWAWGNPPTTMFAPRRLGEICLRLVDGKFVAMWLSLDPLSVRAQVLPHPTANMAATPELLMIQGTNDSKQANQQTGNKLVNPYGAFVVPGSTLDNFHIVVSQWYPGLPAPGQPPNMDQTYRFMHFQVSGLR